MSLLSPLPPAPWSFSLFHLEQKIVPCLHFGSSSTLLFDIHIFSSKLRSVVQNVDYFQELSLFLPSWSTHFEIYLDIKFWYEHCIVRTAMSSEYLSYQTFSYHNPRDPEKETSIENVQFHALFQIYSSLTVSFNLYPWIFFYNPVRTDFKSSPILYQLKYNRWVLYFYQSPMNTCTNPEHDQLTLLKANRHKHIVINFPSRVPLTSLFVNIPFKSNYSFPSQKSPLDKHIQCSV